MIKHEKYKVGDWVKYWAGFLWENAPKNDFDTGLIIDINKEYGKDGEVYFLVNDKTTMLDLKLYEKDITKIEK